MSFSVYIPNPRQRTIMLLDLTAVLRFIFFLLVGCCEWKLGNQYEKNRSFSLALRQHWLLHRDHLWDITATMSFFFNFSWFVFSSFDGIIIYIIRLLYVSENLHALQLPASKGWKFLRIALPIHSVALYPFKLYFSVPVEKKKINARNAWNFNWRRRQFIMAALSRNKVIHH